MPLSPKRSQGGAMFCGKRNNSKGTVHTSRPFSFSIEIMIHTHGVVVMDGERIVRVGMQLRQRQCRELVRCSLLFRWYRVHLPKNAN